ncbi:hypothetical protein DIPPA_20407 [Diplonema papillatum]|nr:hypothetical protein DIPPA_20407 [Diplonema papillatum]
MDAPRLCACLLLPTLAGAAVFDYGSTFTVTPKYQGQYIRGAAHDNATGAVYFHTQDEVFASACLACQPTPALASSADCSAVDLHEGSLYITDCVGSSFFVRRYSIETAGLAITRREVFLTGAGDDCKWLKFHQGYLYLVCGSLLVYDLTSGAPVLAGGYDNGTIWFQQLHNGFLYVNAGQTITALDIASNATHPEATPLVHGLDFTVGGGHCYVNRVEAVYIYEFSSPTVMSLVQEYTGLGVNVVLANLHVDPVQEILFVWEWGAGLVFAVSVADVRNVVVLDSAVMLNSGGFMVAREHLYFLEVFAAKSEFLVYDVTYKPTPAPATDAPAQISVAPRSAAPDTEHLPVHQHQIRSHLSRMYL